MFGSQALDVAIGLALLFFVLATATSALVELVAKRLRKRHRDLEQAIGAMLSGKDVEWAGSATLDHAFRKTSIYRSAQAAAGKAGVAYLSARSFADAAVEVARTAGADAWPAGLQARMTQVYLDVGDDLTGLKAGLESWFDETMAVIESQYKKWATTWLFFAGLVLAVGVNASAINVAQDLWQSETTRAAVVAAAQSTTTADQKASTITDVAGATDQLTELGLPVGWSEPVFAPSHDARWWLVHALGWLITAAMLMLGGPFWFDLLSRLVSLRNAGQKPDTAVADPASATAAVIRSDAAATSAPPSRGLRTLASAPEGLDALLGLSSAGGQTPAALLNDPPPSPAGAGWMVRRLAGR